MTANQYRSAISRLGISQTGAAMLVGVEPRTSRRWASDEQPIPESVAILLGLLLAKKITVADIEAVP